MVDWEWIESLKNGGVEEEFINPRETIIQNFIAYYHDFEADDAW